MPKKGYVITEEHRKNLSIAKIGHKNYLPKGFIPWNKGLKGTHFSPSTEFKKGIRISPKTEFKKGFIPWIKGKKRTDIIAEKHFNWVGDKIGYSGLHMWIRKHGNKLLFCEHCGKTKNIQWANKSGEYKREKNDWLRLCVSCHKKYDQIVKRKKYNELFEKNKINKKLCKI